MPCHPASRWRCCGPSLGPSDRWPVLAGGISDAKRFRHVGWAVGCPGLGPLVQSLTPVCVHSSCAERDEWHGCLSRALPEDYKAQALAAFHHSVEVSGGPGTPATRLGRLAALCIMALAPPPPPTSPAIFPPAQGSHCATPSWSTAPPIGCF